MLLVAVMMTLPTQGIGAPYPGATITRQPEESQCGIRYETTSADPISEEAKFYLGEARTAGLPLLGDSGGKFNDFRMLTFVKQPRFLNVALSSRNGHTIARIDYHVTLPAGCK